MTSIPTNVGKIFGAFDSIYDIAAGNVPGRFIINKFGRNNNVGTASPEDIWDAGGDWIAPTQARTHDIVSTSALDTAAGTGARTVEIFGLDSDFDLAGEFLTLNGTTNVPTSITYTMIHRMVVRTAGSTSRNQGTITATAQTDGTITAQINPLAGNTLMSIFAVPADHTAFVTFIYGTIIRNIGAAGGDANVFYEIVNFADPEPAISLAFVHGLSTQAGPFAVAIPAPNAIPEKTLIKPRAVAFDNNLDIAAGYSLLIAENKTVS